MLFFFVCLLLLLLQHWRARWCRVTGGVVFDAVVTRRVPTVGVDQPTDRQGDEKRTVVQLEKKKRKWFDIKRTVSVFLLIVVGCKVSFPNPIWMFTVRPSVGHLMTPPTTAVRCQLTIIQLPFTCDTFDSSSSPPHSSSNSRSSPCVFICWKYKKRKEWKQTAMPHSRQKQITLQHSSSVLVYEVMHRHTGKYKAACQYRLSLETKTKTKRSFKLIKNETNRCDLWRKWRRRRRRCERRTFGKCSKY